MAYKYRGYDPPWKRILKYIAKILITAAIVMVLVYALSYFLEKEFKIMLEYAGVIVMLVGGMSFLGGRSLGVNPAYSKTHEYAKRHVELLSDTARFVIFMTSVGVILFIVALLIW